MITVTQTVNRYAFFLVAVISFCIIFIYIKNAPLIVDEVDGYQQILNFSEGNYKLEKISAMPTYYFVLTALSKIMGHFSTSVIRGITATLSFLTLVAFFVTAQKITSESTAVKSLLFLFLPTINIFFFLIYTEAFSLLFVLLMIYFSVKKNYGLAGLFGILSVCIRQNNIMWMAFALIFTYLTENNYKINAVLITNHLKKTWVFLLGFILFILFVIANGGVAVGDKGMHPGNLSIGNIVFILFTFFIVFLPLHIYNLKAVIKLLSEKKWSIVLALVLFTVFYLMFKNDHPYNLLSPHYFIRNRFLIYFTSSSMAKAIFCAITVYSALSLIVTKLENRQMVIFYFFSILFLLPSWLIDVRYYVIPFTLFILFKKQQNKYVDFASLFYFMVCCAWVLKMARTSTCFI